MSGMAEVLAENTSPEYVDGYGIMLAFSGDAEDLAAMLTAAGFGDVREARAAAFDQGQKSGIRYASRLAAAVRIGRPDLPGPMSPNPYRAAAMRGEG